MKVLIADRDEKRQEKIAMELMRRGYTTVSAGPARVITFLENASYDLILDGHRSYPCWIQPAGSIVCPYRIEGGKFRVKHVGRTDVIVDVNELYPNSVVMVDDVFQIFDGVPQPKTQAHDACA